MAFVVCTINFELGAESKTARLGRLYQSLDNSVPFSRLWRCEMGKKTQRAWSPEARQRHLDGCRRYQVELKKMEAEMDWAHDFREKYGSEKVDELIELADNLRAQGIDPMALTNFATLVRKNKRDPLTDDQNLKAHELLVQQIPAAEIYSAMFGRAI